MIKKSCTIFLYLISIFAYLSPAFSQERVEIRYQEKPRYQYENEIMRAALDKTTPEYGLFHLIPVSNETPDSRLVADLVSGEAEVDIMIRPTDRKIEKSLQPVRIPLNRGTLGWRIFIIRKSDEAKFRAIKSEGKLKKLAVGQGSDWIDVDIYKHNGYNVQTTWEFEALFRMLNAGRFDYLAFGINECHSIQKRFSHKFPDLIVEKNLAIHYPFARYFWTINSEGGRRLHKRLTEGLEIIITDGTFDRIFREYEGEAIARTKMKGRRVFELENPNLPDTLPLERKELWFSPEK